MESGCKTCGFRTTDDSLARCPMCRNQMVHGLPDALYSCELCALHGDTRQTPSAVWRGLVVHETCVGVFRA